MSGPRSAGPVSIARRVATSCVTIAATIVGLAGAPAANASVSPKSVTYFQFLIRSRPEEPRCLEAGGQTNGAVVQIFACNGTVNQRWTMQPTDSGYFRLAVASSGRCLEVEDASQEVPHRVQILDCNNGFNQQWKQQASADSSAPQLVTRHSGRCLSSFGRTGDRVPLMQAACNSNLLDQMWNVS